MPSLVNDADFLDASAMRCSQKRSQKTIRPAREERPEYKYCPNFDYIEATDDAPDSLTNMFHDSGDKFAVLDLGEQHLWYRILFENPVLFAFYR